MNIQRLKTFLVILAIFFLSGCAVFVRDGDWDHHHHRGHWHHHSSLQQSQSQVQMGAENSGDLVGQEQASK